MALAIPATVTNQILEDAMTVVLDTPRYPASMSLYALALGAALALSGCLGDFDPYHPTGPNAPTASGIPLPPAQDDDGSGNTDDDGGGSTDANANAGQPVPQAPPGPPTPAPAPAPAAECSLAIGVTLDVQLHTLLVNPSAFYVDAMFEWAAQGGPGLTVDVQFKTSATDWTAVASGLPAVDIKTVDMSQYAGASSSWHFRAAAHHPACPDNVAYSSITTIKNY